MYNEYFDTFKTYTAEEIVNLTTMDYESFLEEVKSYSLQSVSE